MKLTDLTFHVSFGEVSVEQLRAYKAHNVSPSDHDSLVTFYSEAAHRTITAAVKDPINHLPGTKLFCWNTWYQNTERHDW